MKEFVLSNGVKAPALAYGTWLIKNEDAARCVKMALEAGYRHIDTAQAYGNEEGVGQGIRESGLKREEVFITSKVKAELKSYKKAKASIDDWMDYYNNERYQWDLAKLSPSEYFQYCVTGIYPL